jgi:hypothetical protein
MQQVILDRLSSDAVPNDERLLLAACILIVYGPAYGIIYVFAHSDLTGTVEEVQVYGAADHFRDDINVQLDAGRILLAQLVLTEPSKGKEHADVFLDHAFKTPELKARATALALLAAKPFHSAELYA